MKVSPLILVFLFSTLVGCAESGKGPGGQTASRSTPFWVRPEPSGKIIQTTISNPAEIQAKRKQSVLPTDAQTKVPAKLRELALDFAVILDGGGKRCSDYRFKEVRPNTDGATQIEIWTIDACGTPLAVGVEKGSCGNLMGSEFVSVSAAYFKGPTFFGNVPLVIEGIGFLPACQKLAS